MSSTDILTQLQFLIIHCLGTETVSGEELRRRLKSEGVLKTGAAFYQMMGRIEDSGLVEGNYEKVVVGRRKLRERRYLVTGEGARAYRRTSLFYNRQAPSFTGVQIA